MNNDERVLELAKEFIRMAEAFNYDTAVERIEDQFRALVAAPQPSALKDKQIAAGQECSPLMDAQTPWVGCGECDVLFPCNNGEERCSRLPRQMRELDKALHNDAAAAAIRELERDLKAERKNVNDLNSALRNAGWGQGEIDSASETIYGMEAQIAALRDELARHQESKFHPD